MDETSHAQTIMYEDVWLARRRAHAVRRLQRHLARRLRHRSRHQGWARGAERHQGRAGCRRRRDRRFGGADELRCLLPAAPYRALRRCADRRAGAAGAAAVHLGLRGHPAGRRPADPGQGRDRALRRHRIHVAQPDRRLQPPRRLQDGAGRVQGLPVGSDAGHGAALAHGRYRRGAGEALPDHARGHGRLRRHQLRAGREGARGRLLQGRGRAPRCRAVRAAGIPDARDPLAPRDQVARRTTSIPGRRRWRPSRP